MAPGSPKVWSFAILSRLGELPVLKQLKSVIRFLFVDLAPGIPVSLRDSVSGVAGRQAAVLGAAVTQDDLQTGT